MQKLPLCSSRQVCKVLERLGFKKHKRTGGSHQSYVKQTSMGSKLSVTVVLGKKELPRGTLKAILERAEISESEFQKHLK